MTPSRHACAACRDAYEAARDWQIARDALEREQRRELYAQRRLDTAACADCDERGRRPDGLPCSHDPEQFDRLRRWVAACREALLVGARGGA